MSTLFFDYETNGLLNQPNPTTHCMAYTLNGGNIQLAIGEDDIRDVWCDLLPQLTAVCAHNLMGFDGPWSKLRFGIDFKAHGIQQLDTQVIGSVVDPEFSGSHSLAEWGRRVNAPKDDYKQRCEELGIDPWAAYNEEMGAYCMQDVRTLYLVYEHQKRHYLDTFDWSQPLLMEHAIAGVMAKQAYHGVYFNIPAAHALVTQLNEFIQERTDRLTAIIKPKCVAGDPVKQVFKKDGTPSANAWKALGIDPATLTPVGAENAASEPVGAFPEISGDFTRVAFSEYDLDSRHQVIQLLQLHGWKPTEWTDKGNPKFTEDSVTSQLGGIGKDLAERFVAINRLGTVRNWLSKVRSNSRIEASAFACGTPTARMRHRTVVNVPRPGTMWGPEMRALFRATPGSHLTGVDADGLELRMLAHYLGDKEFTKQVVAGDIHWYISQLIGLVPKGTVRNKDTHTEEGALHEAIRNVEKTWILDHI